MTDRQRKQLGGGALAVGSAVLAWWLLHGGDGWGLGRGHGSPEAPDAEVRLRVSEQGIAADDEPVSLADAVTRAHAAGSALVVATGAARTGTVADLMRALLAAGVTVHATSDVWDTVEVGRG